MLDATRLYLADHRLHIVAAPGSGKTTLGLEVFNRLAQPTLVLSPTRIIRDQWVDRLKDFLATDEQFPPAWVSKSLDEPGLFTSITYQALHTRYREAISETASDDQVAAELAAEIGTAEMDAEEILSLAKTLKEARVKTLILDEAHHLRAAWWKALSDIVDGIDGMVVVSLTATPPYDAKTVDWRRYEALCGVIDEEISVPELVKAGNLCPHQDFVWTVVPTEREKEFLQAYRDSVVTTLAELHSDETLQAAVREHHWMSQADDVEEAVFAAPDFACALLVFAAHWHLPQSERLLSLLDLQPEDVPKVSAYWWQELVSGYLYADSGWPEGETYTAHRKQLSRRLRDRSLLRHRRLQLRDAQLMKRHMTQSSAKVGACVDIYRAERSVRGDALRQVILTDYIRDESFHEATAVDAVLGAWPVFEALATALGDVERERIALLTGRLVIVHESLAVYLGTDIEAQPLPRLPGFLGVSGSSGVTVRLLTAQLQAGRIHLLVGTQALLGEGWDAPCINSLVLASSVGSYMLTNQMRGRAIRIDKQAPEKVASIWHIVAIVLDRASLPFVSEGALYEPGLADFHELNARFSTFVGVRHDDDFIENNLLRLSLPYVETEEDKVTGTDKLVLKHSAFTSAARLESSNAEMIDRLRQLQRIEDRWHASIAAGDVGQVVPTVSPARPPSMRAFYFERTLRYFLMPLLCVFVGLLPLFQAGVPTALLLLLVVFVWQLPKLLRIGNLLFRHLPVDGTLHQMGLAVRDTLCASGLIETPASRLKVDSQSFDGAVYINLSGGTFHEKSLFADCMHELLAPIENPRYLIIRHGRWLGRNRTDYHAVPTRLGLRKENATLLHQAWQRYVGDAELIYTRVRDNRRILLHARARAFSAGTEALVNRTDRWV